MGTYRKIDCGTGGASSINDLILKVPTFADLPDPTLVDAGTLYYVQTETGSYLLFNRRLPGWYESDGTQWVYAGDNTRDSEEHFFDNSGTSISANNVEDAIQEVDSDVVALTALQSAFCMTFARDRRRVTNLWLDTEDSIPSNLSPFVLPFDATIIAISGATRDLETFDAEIHVNAVVRAGGTPVMASSIGTLAFTASNSETLSVNIDVSQGDEIGVYCRGTGVNRPTITIFFKRR